MVVKPPDKRRTRAQLECGVVNVGGGGVDRLKERRDEIKVILDEFEKLLVPGDLIHSTSASDNVTNNAETNLL